MVRFMVVTFAFLAWAFYMMSGGADFDPDRARLDRSTSDPLRTAEAPEPAAEEQTAGGIEVTRVTLDLTPVQDVLSGRSTRATPTLPQQPRPAVPAEPQAENFEVIPSLVENAAVEGEVFNADAVGANDSAESDSLDTGADIRVVSGSRVNVRGGPGTGHGIVDTLVQGEVVEVLDDSGTGWVRIRANDAGTVGWMAASLLTRG